jgi:hypothetical protein
LDKDKVKMKIIIKTIMIGTGTGDNPRRAYTANQNVSVSIMELKNNTCLCRVAGTPAQINVIKTDAAITVLSDDDAKVLIKGKYPDSDLENLDIADPEIDTIAKDVGLDPKIRADIQIPTRGRQVLQDQENYLMGLTCEKMKLTKAWWDKEVKNGKWATGKELEDNIKDGKSEAHEFVLSRMRTKFKGLKVACDVPNKIAHDLSCLLVPDILPKDRKELTVEAAKAQLYSPCSICVPW